MPGKSKKRRPHYKKPVRQQHTAPAMQSAATTPEAKAAAIVKPAANPKVQGYKPATTAEYPFFTSELKRIAVISVIIIAILVILAIVIN